MSRIRSVTRMAGLAPPCAAAWGDATMLTHNLMHDIRTDSEITWMVHAAERQVERCLRRLGTELREALTITYVDSDSCTDYWRRMCDDGTDRLGDRSVLTVATAEAVYVAEERRLLLRADRVDPHDAEAYERLVAGHLFGHIVQTQVTCRQAERIVAAVEGERERLEGMLAGSGCDPNGTLDDLVCLLFAEWIEERPGPLDDVFGGLWLDRRRSLVGSGDGLP